MWHFIILLKDSALLLSILLSWLCWAGCSSRLHLCLLKEIVMLTELLKSLTLNCSINVCLVESKHIWKGPVFFSTICFQIKKLKSVKYCVCNIFFCKTMKRTKSLHIHLNFFFFPNSHTLCGSPLWHVTAIKFTIFTQQVMAENYYF